MKKLLTASIAAYCTTFGLLILAQVFMELPIHFPPFLAALWGIILAPLFVLMNENAVRKICYPIWGAMILGIPLFIIFSYLQLNKSLAGSLISLGIGTAALVVGFILGWKKARD